MTKDYQIGMLWVEGPLSFMEQLCIVSFLDVGQHVRLYTYNEVTNVPDGVELRDARDILPTEDFIAHNRTGSVALHSDVFRYRMLEQDPDIIWADTDAYCVMPFTTDTGHLHGWADEHEINGGVLRLPNDSPVLGDLLKHTEDPYGIPPWSPRWLQRELIAEKEAGTPRHAGDMPWGVWGPRALTWLLHHHGEDKYAQPNQVLYPVPYRNRRWMARPGRDLTGFLTDDTMSIHFYGRRMRAFLKQTYDGVPPDDCLIGQLLIKHGIDPRSAPIPDKKELAEETDNEHETDDSQNDGAVTS